LDGTSGQKLTCPKNSRSSLDFTQSFFPFFNLVVILFWSLYISFHCYLSFLSFYRSDLNSLNNFNAITCKVYLS
jgi:hypothetical protein